MNKPTEIIEGEVVGGPEAPPAAPAPDTALVLSANPYMAMAQTAMATGRGIDQLERFLDLQLRWDAEQARRAFVAAMAAFKAEPIVIEKRKQVSFRNKAGTLTEYMHAELADITRVVVPLMAKHGLSHRWVLKQSRDPVWIEVRCVLSHAQGHVEDNDPMGGPPDDSGGKNTIQGIASTKTYLERYTLLAAIGVATGGEIDHDGQAPESAPSNITEEQATILSDLIEAYVTNKPKFMDWIRGACRMQDIEELADIPANCFGLVHDQLGRIRKQKQEGT